MDVVILSSLVFLLVCLPHFVHAATCLSILSLLSLMPVMCVSVVTEYGFWLTVPLCTDTQTHKTHIEWKQYLRRPLRSLGGDNNTITCQKSHISFTHQNTNFVFGITTVVVCVTCQISSASWQHLHAAFSSNWIRLLALAVVSVTLATELYGNVAQVISYSIASHLLDEAQQCCRR